MDEGYSELTTMNITQDGKLLRVQFNRPETLNAFNHEMHQQIEQLWPIIRRDRSVGVVLLTGAGRAFSSGGDVKGMASRDGDADGAVSQAARSGNVSISKNILMGMFEVEQPIVSAVQGYAMGLGATVALCADVVIAAEDAVFADTHVNIGFVAGDGGAVIWPLLLPINTAKYYLMTGERITGKDAERLGLVLKAVPAAQLTEEAERVAQRLLDGPSLAIRWTKTVVNKILRERANLLLDTSLLYEAMSGLSEDFREATTAFVEKRSPDFQGR
jgi:enoyl-CoA hydratase